MDGRTDLHTDEHADKRTKLNFFVIKIFIPICFLLKQYTVFAKYPVKVINRIPGYKICIRYNPILGDWLLHITVVTNILLALIGFQKKLVDHDLQNSYIYLYSLKNKTL